MLIKHWFSAAFALLFLQMANAQFSDDFSDGDFTANPIWSGMDTNFTINLINQLQLDAPAVTSESFLSTASQAIYDAEWQFDLELGFNPSSSNRAFIYLVSNQPDLSQNLNGYYILIGNTDDEVSLYRQTGSSTSKIIDGTDDLVALSAPRVRVRVTRDNAGNWELFADTSALFNSPQSQGVVNDVTHSTSTHFGVLCDYTSTRSDLFFFDNFLVTGTAIPDTSAPLVDSVVVSSATELLIYFNEALNSTIAEQTSNYSVNNGIGSPQTASWNGANNTVTIQLSTALQANTNYNLSVTQVEDANGNEILPVSIPIVFVQQIMLNFRDIVINEILADPSPVVGLPEGEFVELFNNTNQNIPLGDLEYSDASTTVQLPNVVLLANSYVILCPAADSVLWASYGQVVPLSPWPTLNNSGDDLSLVQQGTIIDQVFYSSSWYDTDEKRSGGWSLEQVNPIPQCSGALNWRESEDTSGGTPGTENSVFSTAPDQTAPTVVAVTQSGSNQVEVVASEPLDTTLTSSIAINIVPARGNYQINYVNSFTFTITFSSAFEKGVSYALSINNISDCAGNTQTQAFDILIGDGITPKAYDLVINEIYSIPGEGLIQEEFVELYNTTDSLLSLEDLYFADASTSVALPAISMAPGSYAVLLEGASIGSDPLFIDDVWYLPFSSLPSLNNAGDDLELGNSINGLVIDQVSYSNNWYKDPDKADGGYSLERKNPLDVCAGSANWEEPIDVENTQGLQNTWFTPITPDPVSWLAAQKRSDTTVLISATGRITPGTFTVSIAPSFAVDSIVATDASESTYLIYFANVLNKEVTYELTISVAQDCKGDQVQSASFMIKTPLEKDVIINEVLFNPVTGGSDYVELYNNSQDTINLSGWGFHYLNSNNELLVAELSDTALLINPGEYELFTESIEETVLQYPDGKTNQMHQIDLPSFPNDEGRVTLASNLGDTIDDFRYSEDYHFELIRDVDGVALERIDPNRLTNDPTNWHSASELVNYGTPGYENSQFVEVGFVDKVTVAPETFSPDEDGRDDVVTISFKLAEPGYVANITIYDPNGTKMKDLVNNRLLGKEDAVSWDGIRDDGQKADIGIYLIYIELFDLSGDVKHYKETCVLATRF